MEVFGIELQELLFSIFLPFLFFYILLYALLTKSKIFGENANRLNSLLALVISALGIFSLYSLGLSYWLPLLAAFLAVAAFVLIFFFGVGGYSIKKVSDYISGEAFKTEDEKNFEKRVKKCEEIWNEFEKESDVVKKENLLSKFESEVNNLKPLAEKLGKSLSNFPWYRKYEELKSRGGIQ
jgi:divalent metal cation (Fe/Co/Zn/Cd) transporter